MHESQARAPKNGKPAGAEESSCASCGDLTTTSLQAQMMPAYAMGPGVPGVSLAGSGLQTKLTVSHPHDPYEQEADSVAQLVTSGQPVRSISTISPGGLKGSAQLQSEEPEVQDEDETLTQAFSLQRQADNGNEDDELPEEAVQPLPIQRQAADEEEGLVTESESVEEDEPVQAEFVQRDAVDQMEETDEASDEGLVQTQSCGCQGPCNCGAPQAVVQKSTDSSGTTGGGKGSDAVSQAMHQRGAGEPINPGVQNAIESHTGFDMSSVRIHRDETAHNANRSLKARAFTHGTDIWLGPGESPHDLRLMAHEATHVVQQNAGGDSLQTIQRKPSDYQHAEDGGAVRGRLNQRFDAIDESEREEGEGEGPVDRAALRAQSGELRRETRPDVDRPAQEQPRVETTAAAVERETETPPEPVVEGEATTAPEGETTSGEEATGAAEQAAALAQQAFAAASAQPEPAAEIEVQPPEPVTPIDSAGEPLEADPEAEGALASLADRAQYMREQGTLMRAQAAEGRGNAEIARGNLARVTSEITRADEGIARAQEHFTYRREVVGQAEQALGVSEEKAATVAAEAPEYTAKADEGREDSGPMAGEASSMAAENAANAPEDEEAAENSREQGQQINRVGDDSATMDSAISQTRERASSLGEDAARATEMNTETRGTVGASTQQLDQVDQRLGQHSAEAGQARAQVESMASQPGDLRERSNQLEQTGQDLIASSFELESRLHEVQQRYASGTASVPAVEPWEGEVPEEEAGAEGAIQLLPNEQESSGTSPSSGEGDATPVAVPAPQPATTPAPSEVPSSSTVSTTTSATPSTSGSVSTTGPSVAPQITTTGGLQPGASQEQETEVAEPPATDEEPAEGETEPAVAPGGVAPAQAAPEAADAGGAAEEAMPELVDDLAPRERERIDVNQQLPPWLTGIEPESVEQRDAAAQAQEDQRRAEIASINEMAGGRPISQLGHGERVGMALRLVGGRYYNMVSGIKWPGWGGLARALLDPRTMLTGAVGGLNMILNAGSSLFSAERWRQDPLGNLLKSSADIATGLAIILGSITALAGLVAAIMGALILVTFGFAAPIALPVIGVCTTIITTVGGWTIVVGKIALVLQALSLIKNLIDAATAQTASDMQREVGEIQSDINGGAAALMSIVGAKGAQAGIGRLNSRVSQTVRLSRRVGGARQLMGATLRAAPGRISRRIQRLPGRIGRGITQRVRGAREAITSIPRAIRKRISSVRERLSGRGRPNRSVVRQHRDTLRGTARKRGGELSQHEMDAELDVVRNTPPRSTLRGEYDAEVRLPNGHTWRRNSRTGRWCRFSEHADLCTLLGEGPESAGVGTRRIPSQNIRQQPGVARGSSQVSDVNANWLYGPRNRKISSFPGQIARQMEGMRFRNWRHFRETFWRLVAEDAELTRHFKPSNVRRMRDGFAPYVLPSEATGGRANAVLQLNHIERLEYGGGLYDFRNIEIVTPMTHRGLD